MPLGKPTLVRPSQLGAAIALSARPTHVVFLRRGQEPGSGPAVGSLPPVECARRLCLNSLDIAVRPEAALSGIGWIASTTLAAEVVYETSESGAEALLQWASSTREREPVPWLLDAWRPSEPTEGLVRSPRALGLVVGEEMVLLHRSSLLVMRLNAAGAALWRRLPLPNHSSDIASGLWAPLLEHDLVDAVDGARAHRRSLLRQAMSASPD